MTTRINVAICTPSTGKVHATYAASLLHMVGYYLKNEVKTILDGSIEQALSYNCVIGSQICQQREEMIEDSLKDPTCTHVLFWDDDIGAQADCLNLALERQAPVLLANYRRKAMPWEFTARRVEDGRALEVQTDELSQGIEEVSFGGFGFCLIERQVLEKVKSPRFLQQWIEHQKLYTTEDYPFFKSVSDLGIPIFVDHDISKKITHIGDYAYRFGTAPFGVRIRKSAPAEVAQEYKAA